MEIWIVLNSALFSIHCVSVTYDPDNPPFIGGSLFCFLPVIIFRHVPEFVEKIRGKDVRPCGGRGD